MFPRILLAATALTLYGCGCETVTSGDIKTSGLYANLEATADGSGSTNLKATLTLGQGSLTFLELAAGDTLAGTVGTASKPLSRRSLLGSTWYEADFTGDAANTPLAVAFTRASDVSAPSSTATLPADFTLATPAASATIPRSAGPLTVTWTNGGQADLMTFAASGSCIDSVSEQSIASDVGSQVLPAFTAQQGEENDSCSVTLTLRRKRTGTVDPAYGKGGRFEATVERKVTITSTP